MINLFKAIFKKKSSKNEEKIDENLACAILLIEVSYADFKIDNTEINSIISLFEKNFKLSKQESEWLNDKALNLHKDTNCLRKYIKIINNNYTKEQKNNLIKMAWQVARADNIVDKHEEYMIRKLSDLLYVDHIDFIKSKISTK
tara:strand:- start:70 stop:501 length:432 start_codon:yes stop_codon:yes gene_type:complete